MRHLSLLIIAVLLAFGVNALAHEAELDEDSGHFYEARGMYHFHTDDGLYVPNPEEAPANTLVGPWVFSVVPSETESWNSENILDDALAFYTDGALTETKLASVGVNPGVHKGHGWRLDWEIGFLKEHNVWCNNNILEIAGHLAVYSGSDFFYAVMKFDATESAKTTIHLDYLVTARAWLNGEEFFRSHIKGHVEPDPADQWPPERPQAMKGMETKVPSGRKYYHYTVSTRAPA